MSEINPYAAPMADSPAIKPAMRDGIYHTDGGSTLVIHKDAVLPPEICVKSNLKASGVLKRKLSWHHPAVFLALAINILIYAVLAIVLSKKATLYIGMSDEWFVKRRTRIMIWWALGLLFAGAFILAIVMLSSIRTGGDAWVGVMILGLIGALISAIVGLLTTRMVHPQKITDTHVFLRGIHPDFALRYPRWPGGA